MAEVCSGEMIIKKNDVAIGIAEITDKSLKINSEYVDITTGTARKFLDGCGTTSIDIDISGLFTDDAAVNALESASRTNALVTDFTIVIPGYGEYECDFAVPSFTFDGAHKNAVKISTQLASSGDVTFTAAA
jgi:predicted secreted protein